jgi:hypothetical protein
MFLADGEAAFLEVLHVRQGSRAVVAWWADDLRRRRSHA